MAKRKPTATTAEPEKPVNQAPSPGAPGFFIEDEPGGPVLEGDGQGSEQPGAGADGPPAVVALAPGWTPEEAYILLSAVWNVAAAIYGPRWLATTTDFNGWMDATTFYLDRFVPKDMGENAALVLNGVRIAGGVGGMVVRRRDLIGHGPKSMEDMQAEWSAFFGPGAQGQPPPVNAPVASPTKAPSPAPLARPVPPGATPQPPATPAEDEPSGHYKLPREVQAILDHADVHQRPYDDLGFGEG